jgi:hypothetical protein
MAIASHWEYRRRLGITPLCVGGDSIIRVETPVHPLPSPPPRGGYSRLPISRPVYLLLPTYHVAVWGYLWGYLIYCHTRIANYIR